MERKLRKECSARHHKTPLAVIYIYNEVTQRGEKLFQTLAFKYLSLSKFWSLNSNFYYQRCQTLESNPWAAGHWKSAITEGFAQLQRTLQELSMKLSAFTLELTTKNWWGEVKFTRLLGDTALGCSCESHLHCCNLEQSNAKFMSP